MNEVLLTTLFAVQGTIQQTLLGTLASKGLIDLRSMHRDITESVTADLSQRDDAASPMAEALANEVIDRLFSEALRIEAELRGGQSGEEA